MVANRCSNRRRLRCASVAVGEGRLHWHFGFVTGNNNAHIKTNHSKNTIAQHSPLKRPVSSFLRFFLFGLDGPASATESTHMHNGEKNYIEILQLYRYDDDICVFHAFICHWIGKYGVINVHRMTKINDVAKFSLRKRSKLLLLLFMMKYDTYAHVSHINTAHSENKRKTDEKKYTFLSSNLANKHKLSTTTWKKRK